MCCSLLWMQYISVEQDKQKLAHQSSLSQKKALVQRCGFTKLLMYQFLPASTEYFCCIYHEDLHLPERNISVIPGLRVIIPGFRVTNKN